MIVPGQEMVNSSKRTEGQSSLVLGRLKSLPWNAMSIVYYQTKNVKCPPIDQYSMPKKKSIYYRFISQPPIQHPNVDKPKSRYILDLYQLQSTFINVYKCLLLQGLLSSLFPTSNKSFGRKQYTMQSLNSSLLNQEPQRLLFRCSIFLLLVLLLFQVGPVFHLGLMHYMQAPTLCYSKQHTFNFGIVFTSDTLTQCTKFGSKLYLTELHF